jgi:predicted alpha-1,2-mannosidase
VIYACGRFSTKPTASKVFKGTGTTLSSFGTSTSASGTTERVGAVFTFPAASKIASRVGISWISTAQACKNLDSEVLSSLSFDGLVRQTASAWNSQVLSKATISSTNTNDLQLFYSMLYGTFLVPSNRTGENPKWQSSEPYYDDTFTLWDLHRCSTSLWQVLQPSFYEEYIRSLIDIWRFDGYLPDGRSSNFNGRTQGGSNADNVLADAYVKGVRGKVNWSDGYSAMVKDAEVQPPNNNDPMAPDSSTKEGRGALPDYKKYGWITSTYSRAVSRALEYSVNDFSLSQVASGLGKTADKTKYITRSKNWRNHWNPKATSLGFSGFLVPRDADGSFPDQDPLSCGGCYWGDAYYQATPWEYSWGAHHDIGTLVNYTGGPANFVKRLDKMFESGANPGGSATFNNTIMNPSNEPDFATPYLYNFAGRQDLSVQRSRYIAKTYFNTGVAGLPGNSDAGAMQTWLLWNMIGLYPVTGQTTFLIHAPWFGINLDLGGGKSLKITTTGGNADSAYYVQSLKVNGQDWKKPWLTWNDVFASGGSMDFVLGANPSKWFTGPVPPSLASS